MKRPWIAYTCCLLLGLLLWSACGRKKARALQDPRIAFPTAIDSLAMMDSIARLDSIRIADSLAIAKANEQFLVQPVYVLASLKKNPCYGICPAFEIKLYSDGRITYFGQANVTRMGSYESTLDSATIDQILLKAQDINYFELADTYPTDGHFLEDIPLTITSINNGEEEKRIVNNFEAPRSLRSFESFLESLFKEVPWQKIMIIEK
ncbi:MAG: DUF6438 domain-containing protein [Bacteroidota bacterium]